MLGKNINSEYYFKVLGTTKKIKKSLLYWRLDSYIENLYASLSCEANGAVPNEEPCMKSVFQSSAFVTLYTVVFGLLVLFPVFSVTYSTSLQEMKNAGEFCEYTITKI